MGRQHGIVTVVGIVKVRAVMDFPYAGHLIHAGEFVSMPALDAAAAKQAGWISLTRPPRTPPPASPESEKSRRRYRRRDLEAER